MSSLFLVSFDRLKIVKQHYSELSNYCTLEGRSVILKSFFYAVRSVLLISVQR